jgi:hypothetical protein
LTVFIFWSSATSKTSNKELGHSPHKLQVLLTCAGLPKWNTCHHLLGIFVDDMWEAKTDSAANPPVVQLYRHFTTSFLWWTTFY